MADITAGGLCPFFFFNVLPFSFASPSVTPSPPFPVFLQPSARLPSADPAALPSGSVLSSSLFPDQDWGDSATCPGPGLLGGWGIPVFNQHKPQ